MAGPRLFASTVSLRGWTPTLFGSTPRLLKVEAHAFCLAGGFGAVPKRFAGGDREFSYTTSGIF